MYICVNKANNSSVNLEMKSAEVIIYLTIIIYLRVNLCVKSIQQLWIFEVNLEKLSHLGIYIFVYTILSYPSIT